MSHVRIQHYHQAVSVTVGTATESSTTVRLENAAAGMLYVAGATETHTVTVFGSVDGSAFYRVHDVGGQAATVAVAIGSGSYTLPDAIYPLRLIKLVSDTDMGTAATASISIKS